MSYPIEILQFTRRGDATNSEQRYVFIVSRDRLFIRTTWTFKDELGSTVGPDTATFTDIRQLEKILRLRTDALVSKNFVLDEYAKDILEMQSAR
jgi:hypothetical protein